MVSKEFSRETNKNETIQINKLDRLVEIRIEIDLDSSWIFVA